MIPRRRKDPIVYIFLLFAKVFKIIRKAAQVKNSRIKGQCPRLLWLELILTLISSSSGHGGKVAVVESDNRVPSLEQTSTCYNHE